MKTQMTRKEELVSMYWDFYKEVYNVRPRWVDFESCSEADIEAMLENLNVQSVAVFAEQKEAETQAIIAFETWVDSLYVAGAKDRETALRWVMEGSNCNGDWNFLCYEHRLPHDYFK